MKENMNLSYTPELADNMLKASPPVAVSGLTVFGVELPLLIQIGTAIYIALLIVKEGYNFYRRFKDRKDESKE